MNTDHDLDRLLTAWFAADAPMREPEPLLGSVLERTARTKRRPAWRIPERWIPMSAISTRFASSTRVPLRTVGAVALLILALAVGAAVFIGSQRRNLPAPFGPAANGQIVYVKSGDIVARDAVSGVERVIVGGPAEDVGPWFSPFGTAFTFFRSAGSDTFEMWVADQDGANARRIGGPYLDPAWLDWAPQGDVIAVQAETGGEPGIALVARDGSMTTMLAVGIPATSPMFRPSDGGQVLFRGRDLAGDWGLYIVDRDGSNLVHLDLDPGYTQDENYSINRDFYFESPLWSPDGARLMYHTLEESPGSPAGPGFRIHVADIGPTGAVTAESTLEYDPGADDEFGAVWLQTGAGIVFKQLEGDDVRLMVAASVPGPDAARDVGVGGTAFHYDTISPDGTKVFSVVGDDRQVWLTDLVSGTSENAGFTTDDIVVWQRVAP